MFRACLVAAALFLCINVSAAVDDADSGGDTRSAELKRQIAVLEMVLEEHRSVWGRAHPRSQLIEQRLESLQEQLLQEAPLADGQWGLLVRKLERRVAALEARVRELENPPVRVQLLQ